MERAECEARWTRGCPEEEAAVTFTLGVPEREEGFFKKIKLFMSELCACFLTCVI
jgi:hypothetical protein